MEDLDLMKALAAKGKKQALAVLDMVAKGQTHQLILYEGKGITGDPELEPHALAFAKARGVDVQMLKNPVVLRRAAAAEKAAAAKALEEKVKAAKARQKKGGTTSQ